jgi:hypothetical protein
LLAALQEIDRVTAGEDQLRDVAEVSDPEDPSRGLLPVAWRLARQLSTAELVATAPFVDICHPESVARLRENLAPLAVDLGLDDLTLSDILGAHRPLTQACSRMIFQEGYAGIRYLSCYGEGDWECWALFANRVSVTPHPPSDILPNDPDLEAVARIFRLTIEGPKGHYSRP